MDIDQLQRLAEMLKLTEEIQHLPGEQAHQLLLQHLLRHLALLTHHLLLVLLARKTQTNNSHIQFNNFGTVCPQRIKHTELQQRPTQTHSYDLLSRRPLVDDLPLDAESL